MLLCNVESIVTKVTIKDYVSIDNYLDYRDGVLANFNNNSLSVEWVNIYDMV